MERIEDSGKYGREKGKMEGKSNGGKRE